MIRKHSVGIGPDRAGAGLYQGKALHGMAPWACLSACSGGLAPDDQNTPRTLTVRLTSWAALMWRIVDRRLPKWSRRSWWLCASTSWSGGHSCRSGRSSPAPSREASCRRAWRLVRDDDDVVAGMGRRETPDRKHTHPQFGRPALRSSAPNRATFTGSVNSCCSIIVTVKPGARSRSRFAARLAASNSSSWA